MRQFSQKFLIANTWHSVTSSGKTYEVRNPANNAIIAQVPYCGPEETKKAIDSAFEAFQCSRKSTGASRAQFLRAWGANVLKNKDDLARMITEECGKPLTEALGEVLYSYDYIMWFSGEAERIYGDVIPSARSDTRQIVLRSPVGVVAAITPWNFPAAMLIRKAAAAIAAGCTIVAKPAENTPLTAFAFAELAMDSGMPPGVINLVVGDAASIGQVMCTSPKVSKLTFTGSTATGLLLQRQALGKRVTMELGGNAPFIVFDDADLDAAVTGAIGTKFRNGGQTCVCANRFLIQENVHDAFVAKLTERVKTLKIGEGTLAGINLGPLINAAAVTKVRGLVDAAAMAGAQIVYKAEGVPTTGCFFPPMILQGITPANPIWRSEIFGPVVAVAKFKTEEEALHMANDTEHGLAAYLFSRDIMRCYRMMEGLQFGMVGVNEGAISSVSSPFGGVKASGVGREGSMYGTDDYTDIKYCCLKVDPVSKL